MSHVSNENSEEFMCYFCNSRHITKSWKRRKVNFNKIRHYFQCKECKGFSLFPKLAESDIQELYSTSYIENVSQEIEVNKELSQNRFGQLTELLEQLDHRTSKNFLDYGCGAGAEAVIMASRLGYGSFGVEVEAGTRAQAQLKSNCHILSPLEFQTSDKHFDIIFLGDVLEHICNPLEILAQIKEQLAINGILVVQGPLEGSLTISNFLVSLKASFLANTPTDFPPYHVSLANKNSILQAMEINGLGIRSFKVTEPLWPAARMGSREAFLSISTLLLSLTKTLDIVLSKIIPKYGTRFFMTASKL